MKRFFSISMVIFTLCILTRAQGVNVDIRSLAWKVADRALENVDTGDYKGSCLLHAMSELSLASGQAEDLKRVEDLLLGFADGRIRTFSGNSFFSYNFGGAATAIMAYNGVKSLDKQLLAATDSTWRSQMRNDDGVMVPFYQSPLKNAVFIDVAFAVTPFFLYAGLYQRNEEYVDYSVFQIMQLWKDLRDSDTDLFHQARAVAGLQRGEVSQDCWSRGNGWASMAFMALMRDLPKNHKQYKEVMAAARTFYKACLKYQDDDGLWHQEMTDMNSYVETSGSALLLAGLGAAIENGVLGRSYLKYYEKGLKGLLAYIDADGSVGNTCMSNLAPGDSSKEAYMLRHFYFNEPHAFGPVVFALAQALRLGYMQVELDKPQGWANDSHRPRTYVRRITERKDDIAWENDRVAFRVYSSQIADKTMSGVDFWTKSVDYSIIDRWYKANEEGLSYHQDRGEGCDVYSVGRNRGLGGSAVYSDGKLYPSQTYSSHRIDANEEDYIDFTLNYQPFMAGNTKIVESKRIEMVMNTNFYKVTETLYSEDGSDILLAVGITGFGKEEVSYTEGVMSVTEQLPVVKGTIFDLDNQPVDEISIHGAVVAEPAQVVEMRRVGDDHVLILRVRSGVPISYYVGAGWHGQLYDARYRGSTQYWNDNVVKTGWEELDQLYKRNPADFVDTSIGVKDDRASNCTIGPKRPYGSISPSPQTPRGQTDGYHPDEPIEGFGQLHVSGTGWSSYGHFLLMPQLGVQTNPALARSGHSGDVSKAYYYKTNLDRYGISTEITPSHYSSMYRFNFPASDQSSVVFDATRSIMDVCGYMPEGTFYEKHASVDPDSREIRMHIRFKGGWPGGAYDLYLVGVFDKTPTAAQVWEDGERKGAYFTFDTRNDRTVQLKLAISFVSYERAESFLANEIPHWDFDLLCAQGRNVWNDKLSAIKIKSDDTALKTIFYSGLFRYYTLAADRSKDNARWVSSQPFWDDNYAYWDTFRTAYPLMMLIDSVAMDSNLKALVDRFEHNGCVYDGFCAGLDRVPEQGGNDVDHILSEAFLKGYNSVDWHKAYEIVKHNADNRRIGNRKAGDKYPEAHMKYKQLGWIPTCSMSVSQTLEFAYNDYSAYLLAKGLGYEQDAAKYLERSGKWRNLWNTELESEGYKGFIDARSEDGSFEFIDAKKYGGSWTSPFYEASSWTYSYYVPHDIPAIIDLMGGKEAFAQRLDFAMKNNLIGYTNEPAFLATRIFSDAARPDLASYWTHNMMKHHFDLKGYPGNDDTGSMGAWYVFSALGLFPNAGQDYYYLTAPLFEHAEITLGQGGKLIVSAPGAGEKVYIKSCKVGGREWNKASISHKELLDAGHIEFELSDTPTFWAR